MYNEKIGKLIEICKYIDNCTTEEVYSVIEDVISLIGEILASLQKSECENLKNELELELEYAVKLKRWFEYGLQLIWNRKEERKREQELKWRYRQELERIQKREEELEIELRQVQNLKMKLESELKCEYERERELEHELERKRELIQQECFYAIRPKCLDAYDNSDVMKLIAEVAETAKKIEEDTEK